MFPLVRTKHLLRPSITRTPEPSSATNPTQNRLMFCCRSWSEVSSRNHTRLSGG